MTAKKTHDIYVVARDNAGLTDYKIATDLGMSPSTLCDWGKGRYTPKADKLIAIAQYLRMPITAFFE